MPNKIDFFQNRIEKYQIAENKLKSEANQWTIIRGIAFILALALTYFITKKYTVLHGLLVFIPSFGAFIFTVNRHFSILYELKKTRLFIKINQHEIQRLENNFGDLDQGLQYVIPNHPYNADLDIFGKHSLFQLINRSHTHAGGQLLANNMNNAAMKSEILERQNAANEIANDIDFRQNLEVTALLSDKIGLPTVTLEKWIYSEENKKIIQPLFTYSKYLPVITLLVLVGAILGYYTYFFVGFVLLIQGIILKLIDKEIGEALAQTELAGDLLKPFAEILKITKKKQFNSPKLLELASKVDNAPNALIKLQKIIHFLSYRSNPVAAIGGLIFMLDLHNFDKLEQWKKNYKNDLFVWIGVIAEFEFLNSLASFQFANVHFTQAKIIEKQHLIHGKAMGHPLIAASKRISNEIEIDAIGKTIILTGSNMSGKSTFERTLGINIVLALMGAVVCAEKFECAELQLFTSMRTQDSLENDTSSFYAELKRLQKLLKLTEIKDGSKPVLYLLDEILKGTNSKDRHTGAKALIMQLKNRQCAGIISTHDIDLGDEFEGKSFVENFSFSSEIIENELVFDYKLKNGVCRSFNASALMRKIGIEV